MLLLRWFLELRPIYLCVVFPPLLAVDLWSITLQKAKKFTRSKFCWVDFELWTNLSCRCGSAVLTERQCRRWIWLRFELNFYGPIHPPLSVPEILQSHKLQFRYKLISPHILFYLIAIFVWSSSFRFYGPFLAFCSYICWHWPKQSWIIILSLLRPCYFSLITIWSAYL